MPLTIFGEPCSLEVLRAAWPCLWDYAKSSGNPVLKTDAFSVTVFPVDCYGSDVATYNPYLTWSLHRRHSLRPRAQRAPT
jgi:hypothetical protein